MDNRRTYRSASATQMRLTQAYSMCFSLSRLMNPHALYFPGALWNVEIKTSEALPVTLAVLDRYVGKRRLFVTSFRHDVVEAIARHSAVDCGLLLAHRPLDVGAIMAGCAAWPGIRAMVWDYNVVDAAALSTVTANGWDNYVYGAVTRAEHQHCAQLELAGLITDYPQHILNRQDAKAAQ